MIRSVLSLVYLVLLVSIFSSAQAEKTRYAEVEALAAHSLLLDVTPTADGYVAVGERGHVLLSADGETWKQPGAESVPTRATLTAVTAMGRKLWAVGHDMVIIHSQDGGHNWSLQYADPDLEQPLLDIHFDDVKHGYALGAYGIMMTTDDGGEHWQEVMIDEAYDYHLNGMVKLKNGTRLIIAEAGYAWRKTEKDEVWELLELPYTGSMFGVISTDGSDLYAYGLRGHIQFSQDQGDNWEAIKTHTDANLFGATVGLDGSLTLVGAKGVILHRSKTGSKFKTLSGGPDSDISAVTYDGLKQLILAGESGLHTLQIEQP